MKLKLNMSLNSLKKCEKCDGSGGDILFIFKMLGDGSGMFVQIQQFRSRYDFSEHSTV